MLKIDITRVCEFISKDKIYGKEKEALQMIKKLEDKSGEGKDFLGWMGLPSSITEEEIHEMESISHQLRNEIEILVVIGIGGSYLGAKAVIDALSNNFPWKEYKKGEPLVIFAGQNIGEDYLSELLHLLDDKEYGIVVISKSGTTTEPALAFRILKNHLENKTGISAAKKRIIAITDKSRGALKIMADNEGYKTYVIPDDIGGRFSVLTPVGLLPVAVAGFNIRELISGAREIQKSTTSAVPLLENPSALYALTRNELYNYGRKIEILANYNNKLISFSEWWKQLFGESEGKDGKGIFPASVNYTADLHSMGQYIQEGERHIFETIISVEKTNHNVVIPFDQDNLDQLNYIGGKNVDEVNKMAELGTMLAHVDGGVPNIRISIEKISENSIGQLIYFFEKACGISGYLLGVNPFNQPGVEAYKNNMFALLAKPGYEEATKKMRERL